MVWMWTVNAADDDDYDDDDDEDHDGARIHFCSQFAFTFTKSFHVMFMWARGSVVEALFMRTRYAYHVFGFNTQQCIYVQIAAPKARSLACWLPGWLLLGCTMCCDGKTGWIRVYFEYTFYYIENGKWVNRIFETQNRQLRLYVSYKRA